MKKNMIFGIVLAFVILGLAPIHAEDFQKRGEAAYRAQDYGEAARWYNKAAAQGNPYAQYGLGTMSENGQGVDQDVAAAQSWYQKAYKGFLKQAQHGSVDAQFRLGSLLAAGKGTKQNPAEAATWFRKAADRGYIAAAFQLAALYEKGLGVKQDLVQAYIWYGITIKLGGEYAHVNFETLESKLIIKQLDYAKGFIRVWKIKKS